MHYLIKEELRIPLTMFKLWKLVTLFALMATHPSQIQAEQDQPSFGLSPQSLSGDTLSPSPYIDDAFSPETQVYNEEAMAPEYQYPSPAYAPEDDYPYVDNPSNIIPPSPSPATYIDDQALDLELEDDGDEVLYSPSEPPSPTPSPTEFSSGAVSDHGMAPQLEGADIVHANAPVLAFNYSAEDDSGYFSEDYDGQDSPEDQKKMNESSIGYFVVGAVCLLGLGGFAYKKRRDEKRKPYQLYELAKKGKI